ncbi:MAG TPA: hypothetical protein VHQ03_07215, partial [Candidatus Dormibacteraeota bacterium]|nr:hypothetical protein [Candidatus Dormibacteraeota bacterium]
LDLARILLAGATGGTGAVVARTVDLSQMAASAIIDWNLPFASRHITLVAFDPASDGVFFTRQVIGE